MNTRLDRVAKRVGVVVTTLAVLGGSVVVAASPAAADSSGGFEYSFVEGGGVQLDSCADNVCPPVLEIPATLEIDEEQVQVVAIGGRAFDDKELTALSFAAGGSLATIHNEAFSSNVLGEVEIPASVKTIGQSAFAATGVTNLEFESGSQLEEIGDLAFFNNQIPTVEIPAGVTAIGVSAFFNNGLVSVTFASDGSLDRIGGGAFGGNHLTSLVVPSSVTRIDAGAFNHVGGLGLTSLTFGSASQLTEIGDNAFYNNRLPSVDIPPTVTELGVGAFGANNELTEVSFGENSQLTSIGEDAFFQTGLDDISIPSGVTSIGRQAFDGIGMSNVSFASDSALTEIGEGAFRGNGLGEVEIPSSVTHVGTTAFANNENLEFVVFLGGQPLFGPDAFLNTTSNNDPIFVKGQGVNPSWTLSDISGRQVTQVPLPQIQSQPVGGTLVPGGQVNLSATVDTDVDGQGKLSYQWLRNGVEIENAETTSYQATTVGQYQLRVESWAGTKLSAIASVVAPAPPAPKPVTKKKQSVKVKLPATLKRNRAYKLPAKTRQGRAIAWRVKGPGKCKINKKKRTITCKRTTAKKKFTLTGAAKATTTLYAYKTTIKRRVK